MCLTVNHQAAHAADAFAAVVVEGDWFFAELDESLVEDIQHFEKRHVFRDVVQLVKPKLAFVFRAGLSPDSQRQIHSLTAHYL
jgi:hypothetical protein